MGKKAKYDKQLCKDFFKAYAKGNSQGKICRAFGISEHNYYSILRANPALKAKVNEKRVVNLKKKRKFGETNLIGKKVTVKIPKTKIAPSEKIKHLEKRVQNKDKKIRELKELLRITKEHLGKL